MLAEIEARLRTQVDELRLVAGAVEFAAVENNPPREKQPAAYVVPIADTAGENRIVNAVRQVATAQVGVLLAVGNLRDARGQSATAAMETVRTAVRDALVGWQLGSGYGQFAYVRGDVVAYRDGVVWWQDVFACDFVISG